jgi:hypothetical protein
MYRTTSKSLDKRLAKDEQLVYLKCFVPKSFADLRRLTSLDEKTLETVLANLVALGFLREMTNDIAVSVNPKATRTPEMPFEDALARAKRKIQSDLERVLGAAAAPFVADVQNTQSVGELKGVVKKILLKLKLTVSQNAAKELETSVQALLDIT